MFTRGSFVRLFTFSLVVAGVYAALFQSSAQTALPKEIVDLVPKTAVHPSGTWGGSGPLRMGSLVAELRADHPCTDSKTPGHLSVQLIYYADKSPLLSQQLASTEQQYAEKKKRFESDMARAPQNQWPRLIHWGPVKTEDGPGGKLVYYDSLVDCSEYKHMERPEVWLFAISHTDRFFAEIEITGNLNGEEGKAVATEVMTNISKADLSK